MTLTTACYAAGLSAALFCSAVYRVAQPALLYIVPSILLPLLVVARRRRLLPLLWAGVDRDDAVEGDCETAERPPSDGGDAGGGVGQRGGDEERLLTV